MRSTPLVTIPAALLCFFLLGPQALAQTAPTCAQSFSFQNLFGQVTEGTHALGPIVYYKADASLKTPMPETLKMGTYNVLNLYDHASPHKEGSNFPSKKDAARRSGNARAIDEIDPDFQVIVEAENINALRDFNDTYLEGRYEPFLIEGNDSRMDVAILVKRKLPINFEWRSYRAYKSASGAPVFSRDLPVGLVFERDAQGNSTSKPKMAILATHYKSQRASPGEGNNTADRRHEQAMATVDIVNRLRQEFGADLPIVLAGDFNNKVHNSPEFKPLFKQGFVDTLDLTPTKTTDRATHYYFPKRGAAPDANQLDAILVLAPKVQVLKGRVIPDTTDDGQTLSAPKTFEERENRPSDHRPIGVEFKFVEVPM